MAEMTIRRVGVFSLAKIQGLLMLVIGLIIGVIYGLIFMIFGAALTSVMPKDESQAIGAGGTVLIGVLPTSAIAPSRPTFTSTQKEEAGDTAPRSRRRATPSIGWTHSDTRDPSLAPTSSDRPSGIQIDRAMFRSS